MHSHAFAVTSERRKGRRISIGQYVRNHYPPPRRYPGLIGAIYEEVYWTLRQMLFWLLYDWQNNDLEDMDVHVIRCKPVTIESLCEDTKFTKAEVKYFYRNFKQEFPTGIINRDKFKEILREIFRHRSARECAYFDLVFNAFDADRDGQIEFAEFITSLSILSRGTPEEKLAWVFNLYDVEKHGRISLDDLHIVITSIFDLLRTYSLTPTSQRAIAHCVYGLQKKMEIKHDECVDKEEFIRALSQDPGIRQSLLTAFAPTDGLRR